LASRFSIAFTRFLDVIKDLLHHRITAKYHYGRLPFVAARFRILSKHGPRQLGDAIFD
jgi:hypothetical protein